MSTTTTGAIPGSLAPCATVTLASTGLFPIAIPSACTPHVTFLMTPVQLEIRSCGHTIDRLLYSAPPGARPGVSRS